MNKDIFRRFFLNKRLLSDDAKVKEIVVKSLVLIRRVSKDFSNKELIYMYQMLLDMMRGKYRPNPVSMFLILSGLSYLIYPSDIVFDFLPYLGYTDDSALLVAIVGMIAKELKAYKESHPNDDIDISDITDLSFSFDDEVEFDDVMFDDLMSQVKDFETNDLIASENVRDSHLGSFLQYDFDSVVYLVGSILMRSGLDFVNIKSLKKLALKGDVLEDDNFDFLMRNIDSYESNLEFDYFEKDKYYFKRTGDLSSSWSVLDQSTNFFGDSCLFQTIYSKKSDGFVKSDVYEIVDIINGFKGNKLFDVVVLKFFILNYEEQEIFYLNYDSKMGSLDLQSVVHDDVIFAEQLIKLIKGRI